MWSLSRPLIQVGLSANRLTVATPLSMWPGGRSRHDSVPCQALPNAEVWRAPVNALAAYLAKQGSRRPALRVVLSGHFVRWQLLPWRAELTRADELKSYAALHLRETFGAVAESWRVMHVPQPPHQSMPVCSVDAALMDELARLCKTTGAHLAAVTPYFASAFDRWQRDFKANTFWFGVIEPDFISLGLVVKGRWAGLTARRLDDDWRNVLPGMMTQIGISSGLGDVEPKLFLAGEGARPPEKSGLAFHWLQASSHADAPLANSRLALGV